MLSFAYCGKCSVNICLRALHGKKNVYVRVLVALLLHTAVNRTHTDKVARVFQKQRGGGREGGGLLRRVLVDILPRWVFVFEGMSSDCNYCAC